MKKLEARKDLQLTEVYSKENPASLKVIQRVGRYVQDAKLSLIEVRVQSAVGAKRDAEVSA